MALTRWGGADQLLVAPPALVMLVMTRRCLRTDRRVDKVYVQFAPQ
jgi:hypothetical protein